MAGLRIAHYNCCIIRYDVETDNRVLPLKVENVVTGTF